MSSRKRYPVLNLFPSDHMIVWYCAIMIFLIIAFERPIFSRPISIMFYLSIITLVFVIARYCPSDRPGWRHFVRFLYPVFLFTLLYREMGNHIFLIFDQFFDSQLTSVELSVFGVNPTLYIDRHLLNVPTTELLSLSYFLYYPLIPVFFILAYMQKRFNLIKHALAVVCMTFFISYLLFVFYPVEGPRWFFADQYLNQVDGLIFRPLVDLIINRAAFHGGCMPSSHVAVALVIMFAAFGESKRMGWLLFLPLNIGLAAGTVWGRFHYVSDVIVGIAIALVSWYVLRSYRRQQMEVAGVETAEEDMSKTYAT